MNTILLDTVAWDLVKDANGNIAMASDPYSQSQDASSADRLFAGELWYNTTIGIPYFSEILGLLPPLSLIKARLVAAALRVPGVTRAVCYFNTFADRKLSGQIQITNSTGNSSLAEF